MPSFSNLFSHIPSSAVGSALNTGNKEFAKSYGLSALTNFLNDLSDFQKRIKQAQPVAEIKATAQSLNLNAQELYQTEQASLAQGGAAGEAVHFWQNLQKQIDSNPKDEAEIASNLGLEEFKKDDQGRVSGNTLQQLQDVYHAKKGDKKFEKDFRTGLEQIGVMPGSGIYNMITSEESVKAQQAHFRGQTPNEALLKQTGGNLKELIDIKAADDLSNIKSIRGFLDQFKGSVQTILEILRAELVNTGLGVLFKSPPDDKNPPSNTNNKGDDGTQPPTASAPANAKNSQFIAPIAPITPPAATSGAGVSLPPNGQEEQINAPATSAPQGDSQTEKTANAHRSVNSPSFLESKINDLFETFIIAILGSTAPALLPYHRQSKTSEFQGNEKSAPFIDENNISLPAFGEKNIYPPVFRPFLLLRALPIAAIKQGYGAQGIYANMNPITQNSEISPAFYGNGFASYAAVADTSPEEARLINAAQYSAASQPLESETYIGNINIYDAKTDDTFEFAQRVEAVITSALNRTSNIFNPNIAI